MIASSGRCECTCGGCGCCNQPPVGVILIVGDDYHFAGDTAGGGWVDCVDRNRGFDPFLWPDEAGWEEFDHHNPLLELKRNIGCQKDEPVFLLPVQRIEKRMFCKSGYLPARIRARRKSV